MTKAEKKGQSSWNITRQKVSFFSGNNKDENALK